MNKKIKIFVGMLMIMLFLGFSSKTEASEDYSLLSECYYPPSLKNLTLLSVDTNEDYYVYLYYDKTTTWSQASMLDVIFYHDQTIAETVVEISDYEIVSDLWYLGAGVSSETEISGHEVEIAIETGHSWGQATSKTVGKSFILPSYVSDGQAYVDYMPSGIYGCKLTQTRCIYYIEVYHPTNDTSKWFKVGYGPTSNQLELVTLA